MMDGPMGCKVALTPYMLTQSLKLYWGGMMLIWAFLRLLGSSLLKAGPGLSFSLLQTVSFQVRAIND